MVQNSRIALIFWASALRVVLFVAAAYLGNSNSFQVLDFMKNTLGYQQPDSFFGFTLEHLFVSWIIPFIFWLSIFFGFLGKKIDYIIIFIFSLLALFSFYGLGLKMYIGLISFIVVGNLIGFILKLVRERFFAKRA